MPSTLQNFPGISRTDSCTGGSCGGTAIPPDANGEVGPNHYIEAVNRAYAIYTKTGTLLASFTEDQLWGYVPPPPPPPCLPTDLTCDLPHASGAAYACAGSSQGDPIVVYDSIADRWVLAHVAFASPSGPFYECIAASKTSDPVAGGWWLYAMRIDPGLPGQPPAGALNDYPKFGVWHDCLYMGANEFTNLTTSATYVGAAFASFSRADLYSGNPLTWSLGMLDYPANQAFGMFPANSVGHGATAVQPGTPEWFVHESLTAFDFDVRKFTPGPNCAPARSARRRSCRRRRTAPTSLITGPSCSNRTPPICSTTSTTGSCRRCSTARSARPSRCGSSTQCRWRRSRRRSVGADRRHRRYHRADAVQQQIYAPDTTLYRFMPSLAVDRQGNIAIGFSTSGASPRFPEHQVRRTARERPAEHAAADRGPAHRRLGFSDGQLWRALPGLCDRWGDYSAMSVDPVDDCTFWYTNQYYNSQANGATGNWQTRIGSFKFSSCTATVATQRTFVSSLGLDTSPCTLTSPCRQLAVALAATASGGEIIVLDSAGYGPLIIDRPVTIVAPPGVYAGISVLTGHGIDVNPGPGNVTLRGLTINGLGGDIGINFMSGAALFVENCVVTGFTSMGLQVLAPAAANVYVRDSTFRGNFNGAFFGTTSGATGVLRTEVERSVFENNVTTGIGFTGGSSNATIADSPLDRRHAGACTSTPELAARSRTSRREARRSPRTQPVACASAASREPPPCSTWPAPR